MKNLEFTSIDEAPKPFKEAPKPFKKVHRKRTLLNGHGLPVCQDGRQKVRFRSREQAQAALVQAKHAQATAIALGHRTRRREQRSYQCPACSGWHLTSCVEWVEVGV